MGTQSQTTSVFMSVSRLRSCWIGRTSHSTSTEHKGASAIVSWGYRWLRANPGENKQDQLLRRGHPDSLSPEQQNQWILCSKFRTLVEQLSRYPTWALCSQILMRSNEQAWQDWRKKAHHSPPSGWSPGWNAAALSSVPPGAGWTQCHHELPISGRQKKGWEKKMLRKGSVYALKLVARIQQYHLVYIINPGQHAEAARRHILRGSRITLARLHTKLHPLPFALR